MPSQVVLNGNGANGVNGTNGVHHEEPKTAPGIDLGGFRWTDVDAKFNRLSGHHEAARVLETFPSAAALVAPTPQLPPLGPIANFKGIVCISTFDGHCLPSKRCRSSTAMGSTRSSGLQTRLLQARLDSRTKSTLQHSPTRPTIKF